MTSTRAQMWGDWYEPRVAALLMRYGMEWISAEVDYKTMTPYLLCATSVAAARAGDLQKIQMPTDDITQEWLRTLEVMLRFNDAHTSPNA